MKFIGKYKSGKRFGTTTSKMTKFSFRQIGKKYFGIMMKYKKPASSITGALQTNARVDSLVVIFTLEECRTLVRELIKYVESAPVQSNDVVPPASMRKNSEVILDAAPLREPIDTPIPSKSSVGKAASNPHPRPPVFWKFFWELKKRFGQWDFIIF